MQWQMQQKMNILAALGESAEDSGAPEGFFERFKFKFFPPSKRATGLMLSKYVNEIVLIIEQKDHGF